VGEQCTEKVGPNCSSCVCRLEASHDGAHENYHGTKWGYLGQEHARITSLEAELEKAHEDIKNFRALSKFQSGWENPDVLIVQLQAELKAAQQDIADISDQNADLRREVERLEEELRMRNSELTFVRMKLDEAKAEKEARVETLTKLYGESQEWAKAEADAANDAILRVAALEATNADLRREVDAAKSWRRCDLHPDVNGATMWGCPDCLRELRSGEAIATLRRARNAAEATNADLRREVERLTELRKDEAGLNRSSVLSSIMDDYAATNADLRTRLVAAEGALRDMANRAVRQHVEVVDRPKPGDPLVWEWGECRLCLSTWKGIEPEHADDCEVPAALRPQPASDATAPEVQA